MSGSRDAGALWSGQEVIAATGGTGPAAWTAMGVSTDTRTLVPGDLFVALTDQRDGHDFVGQALAKGAAAALVALRPDGIPPGAPLIVVPDVLAGLGALARAARARGRARVIGVTGSVGKTGTKEMLRAALTGQGRVHAAEKSFNNHWGVPLTLARLPRDADFAVIEMGMNHPGEIGPLSRLARPHAAIVTTVAAVHLAAFSGISDIARAKAEIFEGLEPGGIAILNRDIATLPILVRAARRAGARLLRFGAGGRPEFLLRAAQVCDRSTLISARVLGQEVLFKLGAPGRHLALNALATLAGVAAVGADVTRGALALGRWSPPAGRGTRWTVEMGEPGLDGSFLLIDDSYNANPTSMEAALDLLAATHPLDGPGRVARGRRIAVLGDMLELGADEAVLHRDLAALPAMRQITRVHAVGPLMRTLYDALPAEKRGEWHPTAGALAARVRRLIDAGDVVMVKGSLGARMGRVVEAMRGLGPARDDAAPEEV